MTDSKDLIVRSPTASALSEVGAGLPTLREVLGDKFDGTIPLPPEFADRPTLTEEEADDILRAQVTSEMGAYAPHSGQAFEEIKKQVREAADPEQVLRSEEIGVRIAALLTLDGLSPELVLTELAEAARRDGEPLSDAYDFVCYVITQFQDSHSEAVRPNLMADELDRMVTYIERKLASRGIGEVTSTGRRFFAGDQEVPANLFDSFLYRALADFDIFDPIRNTRVRPNRRLHGELRSAYAHLHPRLPPRGRTPSALVVAAPEAPSGYGGWFNEKFSLMSGPWTPCDELWKAWSQHCFQSAIPAGDRRTFFKQLVRWGTGRVRRCRRGRPRVWGYEGVVLR